MLLLIDGDVLAYMACAKRKPPDSLNDFESTDDVGYTAEEDAIYLQESWDNFLKLLNNIRDENWATDFLMAVKSVFNFRNIFDIY